MFKGKILILSKSANKSYRNSHLLWMKYFLLIILKSDIWRKYSCICLTKLLAKRAGFRVYLISVSHSLTTPHFHCPMASLSLAPLHHCLTAPFIHCYISPLHSCFNIHYLTAPLTHSPHTSNGQSDSYFDIP